MKALLKTILYLFLAGGAAFYFLKDKPELLFPVTGLVQDKVDLVLNKFPREVGESYEAEQFIDDAIGKCVPLSLGNPPKALPNRRVAFNQSVIIRDVAYSCTVPGHGSFVLSPGNGEARITLHRQFGRAIRVELVGGSIQVRSDDSLQIVLDLPTMEITSLSSVPAKLEFRREKGVTYFTALTGLVNLEIKKKKTPELLAEPMIVSTAMGSTVTHSGAPVATNGSSATLLPSGFQSSAAPLAQASSTPGNANVSTSSPKSSVKVSSAPSVSPAPAKGPATMKPPVKGPAK